MTFFKALYGYSPPRLLDYVSGITQVEAVDSFLRFRHELIPLLKQNLISAQTRMNTGQISPSMLVIGFTLSFTLIDSSL